MTNRSKMPRRMVLTLTAAAVLGPLMPHSAAAQSWPNGSVQLIVPARAGGGTDAAVRILAAALQETTGQPFVVVNNPGGGGVVAAETVRTAAQDGQTLLFFHSGIYAMHHTGGYAASPLDDFETAAALSVGGTFALAVAADSPYQTVDDLVQASIADPNNISIGIQVRGSSHFMAGLLTMDSNAQFRMVDAGGDADKLVQLQGHQIDAAIINTAGTLQYVETGALRIIGTIGGTPDRDPATPDIPSLSEQGYENAVYGTDFLIMAPVGTDPAILAAIHDTVSTAIQDPALAAQYETMHMPLTSVPMADLRPRLVSTDARVAATAELLGLN